MGLMRIIPASPNATGDTTGADSIVPGGEMTAFSIHLEIEELERAFDSWLDDALRSEGVDLGILTVAQVRTERFERWNQFIIESPHIQHLVSARELELIRHEREEAREDECSEVLNAVAFEAGVDFPLGVAYRDLRIQIDQFDLVASELLDQPELDGWHRRRVEGLQREAQAIRDSPFGRVDLEQARRIDPHQAKARYLAVRRWLSGLFRRAKALAAELRRAPTAPLRRLGRALAEASRGRCLRRVDRAQAGDKPPACYAAHLVAAPDPATTAPILSNAPPAPASRPARTLAA